METVNLCERTKIIQATGREKVPRSRSRETSAPNSPNSHEFGYGYDFFYRSPYRLPEQARDIEVRDEHDQAEDEGQAGVGGADADALGSRFAANPLVDQE